MKGKICGKTFPFHRIFADVIRGGKVELSDKDIDTLILVSLSVEILCVFGNKFEAENYEYIYIDNRKSDIGNLNRRYS